jgi:hypothetical protein
MIYNVQGGNAGYKSTQYTGFKIPNWFIYPSPAQAHGLYVTRDKRK